MGFTTSTVFYSMTMSGYFEREVFSGSGFPRPMSGECRRGQIPELSCDHKGLHN